ncbi:hypothetical protein HPP92_020494 [Vanilla planifolia]|uniref:NPH3 domain-containing protein n=1 Tax=Vanilla planifolia TaxID=51239 RepID=A0A835UKV0_VANPL|nr:hypothetical protein HPP92_020494 [Vanilla planifolia]
MGKQLRVLEAIVSMIPGEPGSVSGKFLVRLLKIANMVDASPSVKAELVRRLGCQLDEVSANDLLFPLSGKPQTYDIAIVEAIMENFLVQFRRPPSKEAESDRRHRSMARVALIFDSYLEFVAHDPSLSASRFLNLAVLLPEIAREEHDGLYQAIDSFLKEHPELSKSEKKQLCSVIDCKKLSPAARTHAIANERMPLRTIVQLLFIQQDKAMISQARMQNRQSLNAFRVHKQGGKPKPGQEMPEFKRKEAEERKGCESEQVMPKHEVSKVGEASSSHNYNRGKRPEERRREEKEYDSKSITA